MRRRKGGTLYVLIFILLKSFLSVVSSEDCPPPESILPCRCSVKGTEIQVWCSHSNLPQIMDGMQSVERGIHRVIDELILEKNQLSSLPGGFFNSLKVLRLMLRDNNLERLSNGFLSKLDTNLVEIYVVERYLRSIPLESLNGLNRLEAITVQSEELKRIPFLSGLKSLKYINIQSKSLVELRQQNIFRHLPNLQTVHINGGENLNRLEMGIFNNLPNLRLLDLSKNGIIWIHLRSLYELPNLIQLRLSQNQINDAGMIGRVIKDLENLQILRLDKNLITKLKEGSFVDLQNLREIHLNHNLITEIHYGAFHRTPKLQSVYLYNNLIKRIHPESFLQQSGSGVSSLFLQNNEIDKMEELRSLLDALPTLKFLEFSNNMISNIKFGKLHGHGTLEQLHLDNNLIHLIDRDTLMAMPALRELRLRNNSLSEMLSMPFWNLPGLKGLDVSVNKFKRIDSLLLTGLPALRRLDLSENFLTFIDPQTFIHSPMLETLNISHNDLTTIHPSTFHNLNRLFEVDCSYNSLQDMIPGLPKAVERISLRGNEISTLPISSSKSFNLPNLRMLDISFNKLEHIPKFTFQSMNQLRVLSLSHNRLRVIEDNIFFGINRLEMLHLHANQITSIHDHSFEGMTELLDLNLEGNRIEILTDNCFRNTSNLEVLNLSDNHIRELMSMAFRHLRSLQYLDLSRNYLNLMPESLSYLNSLKDIDVSFNRLTFISPNIISSWKNVYEIRLSNNQILELKHETVRNLPNLQYLDLSSNELNSIEPGALKNLPELQELVLADNKLVELKDHVFENLPSLQAAHLQHNLLKYISPDSFSRSESVVYLNLSSNHFRTLENMGLRNIKNLEVLDLSNNGVRIIHTEPLHSINWLVELNVDNNEICKIVGIPFEMMPRLRVLSIKNNKIRSIPENVFKSLRGNIAILDLNGNPLRCSCEMLWLSVWLEETNSPHPGPTCSNGKLLRASRFEKNDCLEKQPFTLTNGDTGYGSSSSSSNSDTSNNNMNTGFNDNLPLFNDHGDVFSRQFNVDISETCEDDSAHDELKKKPLPGESEYFYDQYIDYPSNDSNSNPFSDVASRSNSSTGTVNNSLNRNQQKPTILNYNLHNKQQRPMPPTIQSSSPFTFFGYPLPSLNMGRFFGGATSRRADGTSTGGGRFTQNHGKVRMYRPTDVEIEKYLNQETKYKGMSARNRFSGEIYSDESTSTEDVRTGGFRTPFKPPNVEKGGFLPMLPEQLGGFIPIQDPYRNGTVLVVERPFNKTNILTKNTINNSDHMTTENSHSDSIVPNRPENPFINSDEHIRNPELIIDKYEDDDDDEEENEKLIANTNNAGPVTFPPVTESIPYPSTVPSSSSFINGQTEIENQLTISTTVKSTEDEYDDNISEIVFPLTPTPETILLIPPPEEQENNKSPFNSENLSSQWEQDGKSDPQQISSLDSTQSGSNIQKQTLGRSTITKVLNPQTWSYPMSEEYFRETTTTVRSAEDNFDTDGNKFERINTTNPVTDTENASNEYVTSATVYPEEYIKRDGVEWYYENYQTSSPKTLRQDLKSRAERNSSRMLSFVGLFILSFVFM